MNEVLQQSVKMQLAKHYFVNIPETILFRRQVTGIKIIISLLLVQCLVPPHVKRKPWWDELWSLG